MQGPLDVTICADPSALPCGDYQCGLGSYCRMEGDVPRVCFMFSFRFVCQNAFISTIQSLPSPPLTHSPLIPVHLPPRGFLCPLRLRSDGLPRWLDVCPRQPGGRHMHPHILAAYGRKLREFHFAIRFGSGSVRARNVLLRRGKTVLFFQVTSGSKSHDGTRFALRTRTLLAAQPPRIAITPWVTASVSPKARVASLSATPRAKNQWTTLCSA